MDSLEVRITYITREKDTLADEVAEQKRRNDELAAQQNNFDELRQATEQIQMLANLVGHVDTDEVKELRLIRDRSKLLEGEHVALQRRMKELETKVANHEKVTQSSRQSLLQARQRAEEWERRAKEAEGQLEVTQTKLDEVEQSHSQLDADYSLVKLQLEERDAEERLDKVRYCFCEGKPYRLHVTILHRIGRTSCGTRSHPWRDRLRACKPRSIRRRRPRPPPATFCSPSHDTKMARRTLPRDLTLAPAQCTTTAVPVHPRPNTTVPPTTSASRLPRNPRSGTRSMRPGANRPE